MSDEPTSEEPFWQWPECSDMELSGNGADIHIANTPNPYGYGGAVPAMCYPGTPIPEEVLRHLGELTARQINNIGTHTHGKMVNGIWAPDDHETGFGDAGVAERGAIWMVGSMLGGRFDTVDGFFCGGGTDANLMGVWCGRQWLRQRPDPLDRGIVVLATPIVHYSIMKATDLTDIGRSQTIRCPVCAKDHIQLGDRSGAGMAYVGMNDLGEMNVDDLERVVRLKHEEGFRRFLVVPTVGTTVLGSVDPISSIDQCLDRMRRDLGVSFYMHVDASFGGFTVPFLNREANIGFENPSVMSITMDADKMGHLPYPAGIFLCRKGLQSLVARKVAYVRGNEDDTLPGSRSAIAPLLAYCYFKKIGVVGQREYVKDCMNRRDQLERMLREIEDPRLTIGPVPKFTNFLPISVNIEEGGIPERAVEGTGGLAVFHLRKDFVPVNPLDVTSCPRIVYKLCIMPHHTEEHLQYFVATLRDVLAKHPK